MKLMTLIFYFSIFLVAKSWGQAFSMGSFSIGQSSVQVDFEDFEIRKKHSDLKAEFLKQSIQWIRTDNNLLTPRVLLQLTLPKKYNPIYIKIKDLVIFPVSSKKSLTTQFYVNLFHPQKIQVYQNDSLLDTIEINAKSVASSSLKQWVDYSCSPYNLKVVGVEAEYSATGCLMNRVGKFGSETPRLEVAFSSPNLLTPSGDQPPFLFSLVDNTGVETVLVNKNTKKKQAVVISASLPEKLYRLKTALGVGPYFFTNGTDGVKRGPSTAPSFMLYGKFDLTETSSIKAFDALIYNKAFFNNSGLYFSYDLARVYDGQVIFGALLGFQGLHYRYDEGYPTEFDFIYPQGFELTYNHPFGMKNSYLSLGMFASTTSDPYKNIWIRYGSKVFYEINYINWGKGTSEIEMWGLSIGFPFMKAF
jgi:hypothetical protein